MTHPHEHEDRELVSQMERALATAVSTTAALVEAFMRRQQRNSERIAREAQQQSVANGANTASEAFGSAADHAQQAVTETRHALGVGQSDPSYWHNASDTEITDKIRADYGADPSMIGNRDHDRHWAARADPTEILDVYDSARRWSHSSLAAEKIADNIGELLDEYGVDVDLVASLPREEAAELVANSRAGFYATAAGPDDERTVDDITRLIDDRDSALDTAGRDGARAESAFALGDEMSRADDVRSVAIDHPESDAAHAASLAVNSHPTQPRAATATSRKAATKVRPASASRGAGVDRGHEGR